MLLLQLPGKYEYQCRSRQRKMQIHVAHIIQKRRVAYTIRQQKQITCGRNTCKIVKTKKNEILQKQKMKTMKIVKTADTKAIHVVVLHNKR